MDDKERVIDQTKKWINDVIIGCNFCPFAAKVIKQQTVYYQVENSIESKICLDSFLNEILRLDGDTNIETSFLIFPNSY